MEEKVYVQEELYNQINNTKCNVYAMHEYVTCDIDLAIDAKLIFDAKIRKLGCVEKKYCDYIHALSIFNCQLSYMYVTSIYMC